MFVHDTADIAGGSQIGKGLTISHFSQVREGARLGRYCIIERSTYVGSGVVWGDNCKVQNDALVYETAVVGDGVFTGPAVVFTNNHFPGAVSPDGSASSADGEPVSGTVRASAPIMTRPVSVAPVTVSRWARLAAGSVVTEGVLDFALVAVVTARRISWVGRAGLRLETRRTDLVALLEHRRNPYQDQRTTDRVAERLTLRSDTPFEGTP